MKIFKKLLVVFGSLILGASLFGCGGTEDGFSLPLGNDSQEKEETSKEDPKPPVQKGCSHEYIEEYHKGTCTIPDSIVYSCSLCGDSYTEELGIQNDHQLGESIFSEEHNAYIKVCINCDYFEFEDKDEHVHSFKEGIYSFYDLDPENYHYVKCSGCEYKQVLPHQIKEWIPSDDLKFQIGVCVFCGYNCKKEMEVHEHQFNIDGFNEYHHFKECTCGATIDEV